MAVIHGDSDQIKAYAAELANGVEETMMIILRLHARLEGMASEQTWNDQIYNDYLSRFAEHRNQVDSALKQLSAIAIEIGAVAQRYEA